MINDLILDYPRISFSKKKQKKFLFFWDIYRKKKLFAVCETSIFLNFLASDVLEITNKQKYARHFLLREHSL